MNSDIFSLPSNNIICTFIHSLKCTHRIMVSLFVEAQQQELQHQQVNWASGYHRICTPISSFSLAHRCFSMRTTWSICGRRQKNQSAFDACQYINNEKEIADCVKERELMHFNGVHSKDTTIVYMLVLFSLRLSPSHVAIPSQFHCEYFNSSINSNESV